MPLKETQSRTSTNGLEVGADQSGVRAYNERLVMSIIRKHDALPKAEIAKRTGLSAQTASVIVRSLEKDGLLIKGEPSRGKVGQPSVPMSLAPNGVFSYGLKIGRWSAELVLLNFLGEPCGNVFQTYAYPTPEAILKFTLDGINEIGASLANYDRNRIAGVGVAMPFELWNWAEKLSAPEQQMQAWAEFDLQKELKNICGLPVYLQNDATAACEAELVFGQGASRNDFLYVFFGSFIGGGIVLNNTVYAGRTGNAGAIGSMPMVNQRGDATQLIDQTSLFVLEDRLNEKGYSLSQMWTAEACWAEFGETLTLWIDAAAEQLAKAVVSAHSVIDFEVTIVDGLFPEDIRKRMVTATNKAIALLDTSGIQTPTVLEGQVGRSARSIGAACLPLYERFLLDQNVLFKNLP